MDYSIERPPGALRLAMLLAGLFSAGPVLAAECEGFAGATLPGEGTVTIAERIPAGSYTAPNGQTFQNLPAFCRIAATLRPSPDSDIKVEFWLPEGAAWNGRYNGTGNGGYAGSIVYGALAGGVQLGFATANTDQGTAPSTSTEGRALIGRPQKWIDFAYRATHLMTVAAKQVVATYYAQPPQYSYFTGCSNGGFQAFHEVQQFPEDYDGVLAGAPANNRTHSQSASVWLYDQTHRPPEALIPRDKAELITRSVLAACAGQAGGLPSDPYLTDPRACRWDPAEIQCAEDAGDTGQCLTPPQVKAARAIYEGVRNPRTGRRIYAGLTRGSESGHSLDWPVLERVPTAAQPNPPDETLFNGLAQWVFGPNWSWRDFDYDVQVDQIDQVLATLINANDPDLSRFQARGGKLMGYHGWSDALVPVLDHVNYYLRVIETQRKGNKTARPQGAADPDSEAVIQGPDYPGETNTMAAAGGPGRAALRRTQDFYRLFLVPGMGHCSSGPGPNQFGNVTPSPAPADAEHNALLALQRWVEEGVAPQRLTATKYVGDLPANGVQATRPLCPFPQVARYRGQGEATEAASFECVAGPDYETQAPAPEYLR
ncbi:tannase/feruloyl esterase family alpha/beta hydrolase [Dankookia rubra]|uniref:Tannase/feruloyl esterase family alpha/beta hydrolase n=1 Tax=Dankookia rubra TaxID=1442381 RepID=A0A4R5QAQ7_9PROT|nr:tannase/feruloyl esterase family alpha/beta hydrolase [Dankookia rubra]TDH59451.1 tannase/feruloyl esterase family alpha/beta hydrolase [Dankookia rubra]